MHNIACQIAKYMKPLFDRLMEYVLKVLNEALSKAVSAMPSSFRYMFADVKEILTELFMSLYGKMTSGLCDLIEGVLSNTFNLDQLESAARDNTDGSFSNRKKPKIPACYAEDIAGQVMSANRTQINDYNQTIFENVSGFLTDIEQQIAGVGGSLDDVSNQLSSISGNISSALNFTNLVINLFGFELKPEEAVSDFYQFAAGSLGQKEPQKPNIKSIADSAVLPTNISAKPGVPFVEPTKEQSDVVYS